MTHVRDGAHVKTRTEFAVSCCHGAGIIRSDGGAAHRDWHGYQRSRSDHRFIPRTHRTTRAGRVVVGGFRGREHYRGVGADVFHKARSAIPLGEALWNGAYEWPSSTATSSSRSVRVVGTTSMATCE